jgi:anaphase-promoting complex subunit 6
MLNGIINNGKGKEPATVFMPAGPSALPRLPIGPAAMIDVAADDLEGVSRLVDMSVACRYLCAQALVSVEGQGRDRTNPTVQTRQGRWRDALEMLGEANPFKASGM